MAGVSRGRPTPFNVTTRIRSSIFNDFGNWRSEDDLLRAPVDRPDWVGLDEWFHSFTSSVSSIDLAEGDPFSAIANIRNNGRVASGGFLVSFYLSNDIDISNRDVYLGTTFVESLGPLSYAQVPIDTIIPDIPPNQISSIGQYLLGWRIDDEGAIPEFDESNNTGLFETNLLNVREDDHGNFAGSATVLLPDLSTAGKVGILRRSRLVFVRGIIGHTNHPDNFVGNTCGHGLASVRP